MGATAADPALLQALAQRGTDYCVSPAGWWVELHAAGRPAATIVALWPGRYEVCGGGNAPAVYPTADAAVAAALGGALVARRATPLAPLVSFCRAAARPSASNR